MDDIDAGRGIVIPAAEVKVRFSRAGGPGGQNVNKRSTKVEAVFDVAGSPSIPARLKARAVARVGEVVRVVAEDARTQGENRRRAFDRLGRILTKALAPPPPPRRKTKPSRSAVEHRISAKKLRGKTKRLRRDVDDD